MNLVEPKTPMPPLHQFSLWLAFVIVASYCLGMFVVDGTHPFSILAVLFADAFAALGLVYAYRFELMRKPYPVYQNPEQGNTQDERR